MTPSSSKTKPIQTHRDLTVWNVAVELVTDVYTLTGHFPADERFGLTAQIRRAAVSVVANIAEGHARAARAEYRQFANIARGSVAEVDAELELAERLGYATTAALSRVRERTDAISRMLTNLRRSLSDGRGKGERGRGKH